MFGWFTRAYGFVRDFFENNRDEVVRRGAPILAYICFGIALVYAVIFIRQISNF